MLPFVQRLRAEFDRAMFGTAERIALGPFKYFYRDRKWIESCKFTHEFATSIATKALLHRYSPSVSNVNTPPVVVKSGKPRTLLEMFAESSTDITEVRNSILQFFMVAPHTVAILLSNVISQLARHPHVWKKLRKEVILQRPGFSKDRDALKSLKYLRHILNEST